MGLKSIFSGARWNSASTNLQNHQPHSENTSCDCRNSSGCLIHKFQRYGYCRLIFVTLVDNKPGNGNPTVIFFSLSCQLYFISIRSMLRNRMALWWCNYGGSRNRHSRNLPSQDLRFAARDEAVLPRRQAIRTLSQFWSTLKTRFTKPRWAHCALISIQYMALAFQPEDCL